MAAMEDMTIADQAAADWVADPALLDISREFSVEYGLGWFGLFLGWVYW